MNVPGKLMSMDFMVGGNADAGGHDLDLHFAGHAKEFVGGSQQQYTMTLHLQAPRGLVKDFRLGDDFRIDLSHEQRPIQLDLTIPAALREADAYLLFGQQIRNVVLLKDDPKDLRAVCKEAFFTMLKIRLQDPEFRATMRRDMELIGNKP